ncbi:ribbon-helix-helix protein, CopG family [Marinobacter flavimaris]|uniref:ribbon-helix-helix protein, CopG family n=1 Tax=Marinobacter flavimaris TaxID=262076 RepID=UPI00386ACCF0
MDQLSGGRETLLSWIDIGSQSQVRWVADYLAKKGRTDLYVGTRGEAELLDRLKSALNDEATREMIKRMRGAWSQKKYRESKGQQVSFQLPDDVVKGLNRIAQERGCSKSKALRQVISDAAKNRQRVNRRSQEKIRRLESNLKKLRSKKLEAELVRDRTINALLDKLTNEIVIGCLEEVEKVERGGGSGVGVAGERFDGLLRERVAELEKLVPEVQQIRPQGKTIRDFFDDYL